MATVITGEKEVTEEEARAALQSLVKELDNTRQEIAAHHSRMERLRAENDALKQETRATLKRIEAVLARL